VVPLIPKLEILIEPLSEPFEIPIRNGKIEELKFVSVTFL
jgi:hypothetical protein